ncbi:MAG TPA: response regulator transcription factor [Chloroflexaceae bacterium]|nr:response regulator transcription factor [Chloroflexaceae bacterium]
MINILLVDDQESILAGLRAILSTHDAFAVVATARSGEEALDYLGQVSAGVPPADAAAASHLPDIVLMDIRMPGMGGVMATRRIKERFPQVTVLILTTFDDEEYIIDALHNEAAGYLLKDIGGKRLIESIYEALAGNLLLSGRVAAKLAHSVRQHVAAVSSPPSLAELALSEREVEIARYIAGGLNAREIAARTALSLGTVKNYTSSIYAKLGTSDRSKAIVALQTILGVGAPQTQ